MKPRHLLRLGAALTATLVVSGALFAPAQATSTGSVSGTFRASGTSPIEPHEFVVAIWPASSAPVTFLLEPPKYKELTHDGHYSLTGIKPGKYIVGAADFHNVYGYSFYKSHSLSSNAKVLTVKAGHTTSDINITLHHSATIGATVRNTAGDPLTGINVTAYDADGLVAGFNDHNNSGGDGSVQISGIPAGSYRFKLQGGSIPTQWANGIDHSAAAKSIKVTQTQHLTGIVFTARANPAIASTGRPTISGTQKRTHTLTAHNGTWATTPASFTYRWLRNGRPISGATSKTYKLRSADVGKYISVRVGAVAPDTVTGTRVSSHTGKIKNG